PRLAAVGGLVESAIAPRSPERPLRRDVDRVRVPRINNDLADVLRVLQADVLPRPPAVDRLVHPVPVADAPLAVILTRPDPDDVRVLRIEDNTTDRVRAFVVENRRPGDARVGRLPDSARRNRHEVM